MWIALALATLGGWEPALPAPTRIIVATRDASVGSSVARIERSGLRLVSHIDLAHLPDRARSSHAIPHDLLLFEAGDTTRARLALASLRSAPELAWAELDEPRAACVAWVRPASLASAPPLGEPGLPTDFPNDPLFRDGRQWGLRNAGTPYSGAVGADVRAVEAWAVSVGADRVVLGVVDTGIDLAQPELGGTLADGSPRLVHAFNVASYGASVADSVGHGTLVAGVMAARAGNGSCFDSLGVAGVCGGDGLGNSGCRIVPVRITNGGSNTAGAFQIANGILHAAASGARAINLSFAGTSPSRAERLALESALASGAIVVAASGNWGYTRGNASVWPAAHAAEGLCVQVGASDAFDRRAEFSSFGPGLDLLAPGVDVWGPSMTYVSATGYQFPGCLAASGTSFAAPFATGAIGLVAATREDLAPDDYAPLLRAAARDVGAPGLDSLSGAGVLDLERTLRLAGRDRALWHSELEPLATYAFTDTLLVSEHGVAVLDSLGGSARVEWWETRATFDLPDSLGDSVGLDSTLAWIRGSGTRAMRHARVLPWLTPWATLHRVGPRRYEAEGWLAHVVDPRAEHLPASIARWLPCPPESARIAVSALGRRRGKVASAPATPRATIALSASPNPFRGTLNLRGRPGDRVEIVDLSGRRVARVVLDEGGHTQWNGADASGRDAPAGLYWARVVPARGSLGRVSAAHSPAETTNPSPVRVLKLR